MEIEFAEDLLFKWHDYLLFALMLIISTGIGLYFNGRNKSTSISDYFLGGKDMGVFPIGMSISGSVVSAIAMAAYPNEMYTYTFLYCLFAFTHPLMIMLAYVGIIPVFYNLQLSSIYEYMELRFDKKLRKITSCLYTLLMLIVLPLNVYLSSVSLEQGTGFNIYYFSLVQCLVCTFYTTIGGLKTVVWTDTLQFGLMLGTTVLVAVIGTAENGGVWKIFQVANEGKRFDFVVDVDLTLRDSLWTALIGNSVFWLQNISINQAYIQKCFALPTLEHVKKAFALFAFFLMLFYGLISFIALIMYNVFKDCDPLSAGKIKYSDQIIAYYILQVTENFPGVAGLFIAGITSAVMSTLSAGMNALSCTIYKDFVSPFLPESFSERKTSWLVKLIAGMVGLVCMAMIILLSKMGNAFQVILSVGGITSGPMFGLFVLGMFTTRANSKGAIFGLFGSLAIMFCVVFGSVYYKMNKLIVYETLPMSTAGCRYPYNNTTPINFRNSHANVPYVFRISHNYFILMGLALVIIIGLPVSLLTKSNKAVSKDLLSPLIHWTLPKDSSPSGYTAVQQDAKENLK